MISLILLLFNCNYPILLQSEDSDNESVDSLDVLRWVHAHLPILCGNPINTTAMENWWSY